MPESSVFGRKGALMRAVPVVPRHEASGAVAWLLCALDSAMVVSASSAFEWLVSMPAIFAAFPLP